MLEVPSAMTSDLVPNMTSIIRAVCYLVSACLVGLSVR